MSNFVKVFEVQGHQVCLMDMAEDNGNGCSKLEVSTSMLGVRAAFGLWIPHDKVDNIFDDYDHKSATDHFEAFKGIMEVSDKDLEQ